jgi:hypothetical protein
MQQTINSCLDNNSKVQPHDLHGSAQSQGYKRRGNIDLGVLFGLNVLEV